MTFNSVLKYSLSVQLILKNFLKNSLFFFRQEEDPHLGGSALNTSRILKALGTEPLFFGAVGDDKQAEVVNDLLIKSGMESK